MTIKQQGGIFGRNPTFNEVSATDAEITNQLDVKTISMVSNNPLIYLDDTDVADLNTRLRNQSGIFRIQDVADDGSTTTQVQLAHSTGDLTVSTGNLVIGTSGNGIDFSATSDASGSTSELFDDYEEGTWTPAYEPTTGAFTTITTVSSGTYTKIGRMVHVTGTMYTNGTLTVGTASGNLKITGLPYTNGSIAAGGQGINHQAWNLGTDILNASAVVASSSSHIILYKNTMNGSSFPSGNITVSEMNTAGNNFSNLITFNFAYQV